MPFEFFIFFVMNNIYELFVLGFGLKWSLLAMERAIVIYTFDSTSHDELKVNKNDILDIVGKNGDWWTLRDKNGRTGLVPVNYLAAPIDDNSTKVVSRGKTTKKHNGSSETEISVNAGEQVAILDKSDTYWWLVGWQGKAGYIPKKIINEFQV